MSYSRQTCPCSLGKVPEPLLTCVTGEWIEAPSFMAVRMGASRSVARRQSPSWQFDRAAKKEAKTRVKMAVAVNRISISSLPA
jgi:hypothetical protein